MLKDLRLAQQAADPMHRLEAHAALGTTLFYLGDYAAARMHLEQGGALIDESMEKLGIRPLQPALRPAYPGTIA